ncbi:hypothetical protein VIGAN_06271600 [Vigna angularis var. angularis]|uniref:Uncharacterized protein n=1 Tax=Vigna angularis var. angularis TaxID=157739 RepID=A0A0S3SEY0_PHAAN|nr:hypothetical protein VIGAN_06271600 [Vigna angularis var. angularis]
MNMGLYTHKIPSLVRGLLEWYQKQICEGLAQNGQYLTCVKIYVCVEPPYTISSICRSSPFSIPINKYLILTIQQHLHSVPPQN